MSAKINNFINLGIGNAGDGGESLPVYGVYWSQREALVVYEISDFSDMYDRLHELDRQALPLTKEVIESIVTKPIFIGIFYGADTGNYIDSSTNIELYEPFIKIYNYNGNTFDVFDGNDQVTNMLAELNINKGVIYGMLTDRYLDNELREYFTFVVSLDEDTGGNNYSGFGTAVRVDV